MYVCLCRGITDQQIRSLCQQGVTRLSDIRDQLGVSSDCGRCGKHARQVLQQIAGQQPDVFPVAGTAV